MNGNKVSNKLKNELQDIIKNINKPLTLAVIQIGTNESSNVYIQKKKDLCKEMGICFKHLKYSSITEEDLIKEIKKLNNDNTITGILVQLPLPKEYDESKIINTISYYKDVDGLTSINIGKLYTKEKGIIPCTALGVMELLKFYNVTLEGKRACIIGRTNLLAIPLFKLLLDKNCTVTMCHSKTNNLREITKNSDILITATGVKNLIKKDFVKDNAVIIDVGITRCNNKIYGDVLFDEVCSKSSFITPVPGGVGPMTVIMLINNLIECYELQKNKN